MEGWYFLAVAIVIAGSAFIQSSIGFGYAVVALAVLPFFVEVRQANIVVSLSILVPLTSALWMYRRGLDWRMMFWCLGGAVFGLPVGFYVFSAFEEDWLIRGTGLVIFLVAVDGFRTRRDRPDKATSPVWSVAAGAASGLLAGSVGVGGPPVAAYAARQDWSATRFKAFVISFSLMLSLLKAFGLFAGGWINQTILLYSVAVVPFGLAGGYLGAVVSRNIDGRLVRRLAMVMLLILSVGMIIRGQPQRSPSATGDALPAAEFTNPRPSFRPGSTFPAETTSPAEATSA